MKKKIGENIRYYRELAGITQVEFAQKLGYGNHTSISKIEQGKVDLPLSKIAAMSRILNVSPEVFFSDVPDNTYHDYIKNIKRLENEDPEKLRIIREMLGIEKKSNSSLSREIG